MKSSAERANSVPLFASDHSPAAGEVAGWMLYAVPSASGVAVGLDPLTLSVPVASAALSKA